MSNSLQPHGLQYARLLCPPLSPGVCSNSCLKSQWCYLTISSSAARFSFCLQSFSESESFPVRSALHIRWPKYWSFSTSPSNEYSGLISFKIDWFDLLAVQGALKSLLQPHSSKASIQCSAFIMVQISHPYITTGKTTAMTILILILTFILIFEDNPSDCSIIYLFVR